jgi:hypothetical protein
MFFINDFYAFFTLTLAPLLSSFSARRKGKGKKSSIYLGIKVKIEDFCNQLEMAEKQ